MNDKPILIDALHICMGGGLMILNHLINNLVRRKVNFVLLKDSRCPTLQSEDKVAKIEVLPATFKQRRNYYKEHRNDFRSVLCFGNIPPCIRLNAPVHTYLHNVSLLKIPSDYDIKHKVLSFLKKTVLKHYSKNTTDWIVQTSNTAELVARNLCRHRQGVLQYPFFYIPENINRTPRTQRTDYIFVGNYTNAKGHEYLVDAWIKLHSMGIDPILHLTVTDPAFIHYINAAKVVGVRIVNHGIIPFEQVLELYNVCKATVYPSLNESLGLGIVEAMAAGCDVIGCDLPYIHSVCIPSCQFEPCNSDSIVEAILRYENGNCVHTKPLIKDMVNEFIDFICR